MVVAIFKLHLLEGSFEALAAAHISLLWCCEGLVSGQAQCGHVPKMVTSQQPGYTLGIHSVTMFCLPSEQSADTAMGPAARMQATFKYEIGSQENCYLLL